jgi:hypothetical protein
MRRLVQIPLLLAGAMASLMIHAADNNGPDANRAHRAPPPEAYEACDGKKAGDKVSFTSPRGEKVAATCNMMPARLVAMPDHPPQGGPNGQAGPGVQGGNPPPRPN